MKQFLSVHDIKDLDEAINKSLEFKYNALLENKIGLGKYFGMVFMNPSLRTKISSQIAAENLGMKTSIINFDSNTWALEFKEGAVMKGDEAEHIIEAAGILGKYMDILGVRSFPLLKNKDDDYSENIMMQFKKYSKVPIVNLESATLHPLQSLADIITINEHWMAPQKPKVVLSWAPHVKALPQSVPNSFAQWINFWGKCDLVVTHPKGYELDEDITGKLDIEYDQDKALKNADFVYVKNWSGTSDYGKIMYSKPDWMISQKKMLNAKADCKIMHCLPVRRNLVISDEVLDSDNSIIFQQTKNRICATQFILYSILKNM